MFSTWYMDYRDFKDLPQRIASDKIILNKAFNIAKNQKYDGYQRGLVSMVYKLHDKRSSGSGVKSEIIPNQELAEELHKPVIRKFEKRKIYPSSKTIFAVPILQICNW